MKRSHRMKHVAQIPHANGAESVAIVPEPVPQNEAADKAANLAWCQAAFKKCVEELGKRGCGLQYQQLHVNGHATPQASVVVIELQG